ncbi:MAG: hypothetical protein WC919_01165 [Candidatus Paceibacterota bacterium]|jgi:hypothetical protein
MADLIVSAGFKSGKLTAIEPILGGKFWLCHCECGKTTKASKWHLLRGLRQSCGCRTKQKPQIITCVICGHEGTIDDFYSRKNGNINSYKCKRCLIRLSHERQRKTRLKVLRHYGGETPKCACCGESHTEFLSIDHINGGGNKHRKNNKIVSIYAWLYKHKFPDGFRVLCHNCNFSYGLYGYCPHVK